MTTFAVSPATNVVAPTAGLTRLIQFLRALHQTNPWLAWAGWAHVAVAVAALLLWPLDSRVVTGLNVWIKPLKFSLSGLTYLWTLAWLLTSLPAPAQRAARRISRLVGISMLGEIVAVTVQAARGTTSHFNVGTSFDALVFLTMGLLIAVNTVAVVWLLGLLLRYRSLGSVAYGWGIRLGVLLFLAGSIVGGAMSGNNGHTVGAADGGPGLPVLGWSTRHGDLRIAHFLGLHALQIIPLLGWLLSRYVPRRAVLLTWLGAAAYAGLVLALFRLALAGRAL